MYSRGRRGAPAKGVGRDNRRESSNLSISAKNTADAFASAVFFLRKMERFSPLRHRRPQAAVAQIIKRSESASLLASERAPIAPRALWQRQSEAR